MIDNFDFNLRCEFGVSKRLSRTKKMELTFSSDSVLSVFSSAGSSMTSGSAITSAVSSDCFSSSAILASAA